MASAAAAPRPPAPPAPPPPPPPPPAAAVQWLGPRVSFSLDDASSGGGGGAGGREAAAASASGAKAGHGAGADFEFLLGGCAAACSMLPADELFSGGKLVPLRIPAPADEPTTGVVEPAGVEVTTTAAQSTLLLLPPPKQQQAPETPRGAGGEPVAAKAGGAGEPSKIPARRWRDLLRLRKQQSSGVAVAAEPRPLRRLLRRGPKPAEPEPSLSLPLLLREPAGGCVEPADTTTKAAAAEKPGPPATTTAPSSSSSASQHQSLLPPKIRLSPSASHQQHQSPASQSQSQSAAPPPPPPSAVAADSPRLNAAGKVVFNGLGRSSSSPSSLAGGRRHRNAGPGGGAMERSYSAHVRVAPVLNVVPVCSLRGSRKSVSVFGIDRLFSASAASSSATGGGAGAAARKTKAAKKDTPHAVGNAGAQ